MFEILTSPDAWVALLTLTFLEIVLGIDNIVFHFHRSKQTAGKGSKRGLQTLALYWQWYSGSFCYLLFHFLLASAIPFHYINTSWLSIGDKRTSHNSISSEECSSYTKAHRKYMKK